MGGFKHAFAVREHLKGKEPKKAASHDTPVTVAAELGTPGVLLLGWLLVAALVAASGRAAAARGGTDARPAASCSRAIFAHSLFYSEFFEDPLMWGASP